MKQRPLGRCFTFGTDLPPESGDVTILLQRNTMGTMLFGLCTPRPGLRLMPPTTPAAACSETPACVAIWTS